MSHRLQLSNRDQMCLAGDLGPVQRFAMELLVRVGRNYEAHQLIDVKQAHLVGSYHSGPGNLKLLDWLADCNAKVVIPTTLNASSEDLLSPTNVDAEFLHTTQVVQRYKDMGCEVSLTCAPYHLPKPPAFGDCVAWAESNAVVFANSVLGARSNMTVQYLDLCAALTGRMPEFGLYLTANRRAQFVFELDPRLPKRWLTDDGFYQLLGFHIGRQCGQKIPALLGVPSSVTEDQLRALGAAAAAAGSVNMIHVIGVTPEAKNLDQACQGKLPEQRFVIARKDIAAARRALGGESDFMPDSICLGTPHFSVPEFDRLLTLLKGNTVAAGKSLVVTTSRHNLDALGARAEKLRQLGVTLVADRCCYYPRRIDAIGTRVMTNAAKWAYYGPGNLQIKVQFARLETCVAAATGAAHDENGFWND